MATTAIYGVTKPTVAGDSGIWGGELNTGLDTWDNEIARPRLPFLSPTYNVGGTTTLDLNQTSGARVFAFTVSGATTLAFTNVPSASFDCRLTLIITNGSAFALTFPASVTWLAGSAPALKSSGVDILDLETKDGGTTWYGALRSPQLASALAISVATFTQSSGEQSIVSYSVPANKLSLAGQQLRVTVRGVNLANAASSIHIKFGATDLQPVQTVNAFAAFSYDIVVVRVDGTNQIGSCLRDSGALVRSTPAETLSGAVLLDVRGTTGTVGQKLQVDALAVQLVTI